MFINYDDLNATREFTRSFIEAGATHLVLNLRPPYPEGIVHQLANEVAEPLRAEFSNLTDNRSSRATS